MLSDIDKESARRMTPAPIVETASEIVMDSVNDRVVALSLVMLSDIDIESVREWGTFLVFVIESDNDAESVR